MLCLPSHLSGRRSSTSIPQKQLEIADYSDEIPNFEKEAILGICVMSLDFSGTLDCHIGL